MTNLEKQPFRDYDLEHEKANPDIFSIRLNKEERKMLEVIKKDFNIKSDGKALKVAARVGHNVIHGMLGAKLMRYLFKKDREKLEDYQNF